MKRVPALCLISGAIFSLSALVGCEEAYDDTTDDVPMTTPETTPPVEDTTDDYTDETTTTPPPVAPEQEEQMTYTGVLQRSAADETGESRWMLTGTAQGDVEVDISSVEEDAMALEGTRVVVTGQATESTDSLGGMTTVVTAESVERAE